MLNLLGRANKTSGCTTGYYCLLGRKFPTGYTVGKYSVTCWDCLKVAPFDPITLDTVFPHTDCVSQTYSCTWLWL